MIEIDGDGIGIEEVAAVALGEKVKVSEGAKGRVRKCREYLEGVLKEGKTIYGVTTGFGHFRNVNIPEEKLEELQENIIRSHSAGVGEPFPADIARAAMLIRLNTLAKGFSGVRVEVVEKLEELLNKNIVPVIPEKGSVGASGDLAPLSHMALVLIGEGEVFYEGNRIETGEVFRKLGIQPLKLGLKEGLSLNNGTAIMCALGSLAAHRAERLAKSSIVSAAMSLEALKGIGTALDPELNSVRPHEGQKIAAEAIGRVVQGSELVQHSEKLVQDAYSLRCTPIVIGAVIDTIKHVKKVLEIEINSATDNPLVFPEKGKVLAGGNFHGQPVGFVMDFLSIALSSLANISERRVARLVDPNLSNGLPAFLVPETLRGLNSGFMLPQYTAASLVSENKILSHPASVDSIPTSANQEDHVSMATTAARKAVEILKNSEYVIAIELFTAAQALEFRKPAVFGKGTETAYNCIRKHVEKVERDRALYKDIEKCAGLVRTGEVLGSVEAAVGKIEL